MNINLKDKLNLGCNLLFKYQIFHLIYFITNKCNLKCKMCFYWQEIESKKKSELSINEIELIAKNMPNFFWLQLSGGEPFLRDDIDRICSIFANTNNVKYITIPTNGVLTDKIINKTELILSANQTANINISLSINGIRNQHDAIVGVNGSFDSLIETSKKLQIFRKKYKNFALGAIVTQTRYNDENLKEILIWIKNNIELDNITLNFPRGSVREKESCNVNIDTYLACSNWINKELYSDAIGWKKYSLGNTIMLKDIYLRKLVHNMVTSKRRQIQCYAGRLSFVINPVGDVFPCELMTKKIGNIKEYDYNFNMLLKSKKTKMIYKDIQKTKCFCTHECFLTTSILFNYKFYLKILIDKLKTLFKGINYGRK